MFLFISFVFTHSNSAITEFNKIKTNPSKNCNFLFSFSGCLALRRTSSHKIRGHSRGRGGNHEAESPTTPLSRPRTKNYLGPSDYRGNRIPPKSFDSSAAGPAGGSMLVLPHGSSNRRKSFIHQYQYDWENRSSGNTGSNTSSYEAATSESEPKHKRNNNHVLLLPPRLIVSRGSSLGSANSSFDSNASNEK